MIFSGKHETNPKFDNFHFKAKGPGFGPVCSPAHPIRMGPHPPNRWMGFPPPCQWVPRGPEDFPTQWLLMVLLTPTCHFLSIQCYKQQKTFWAKAHCSVSTKMMKRRHNLWFSVNCKCSGSSRSFCRIATSVSAVSCTPVAGGERPSIRNSFDNLNLWSILTNVVGLCELKLLAARKMIFRGTAALEVCEFWIEHIFLC